MQVSFHVLTQRGFYYDASMMQACLAIDAVSYLGLNQLPACKRPDGKACDLQGMLGPASCTSILPFAQMFVTLTPYHLTPYHLTPYHLTPYHLTPYHLTPYHLTPYPLDSVMYLTLGYRSSTTTKA